jgi:hypothetical protein
MAEQRNLKLVPADKVKPNRVTVLDVKFEGGAIMIEGGETMLNTSVLPVASP